ncbi:hypothetical protein BV898_10822, partial [Hypsibius exemplaris]
AAIIGAGVWAEESDGQGIACCTSGSGEHLIRANLAREVCKSLIHDESALLADVLSEKFFSSVTPGSGDRFMGGLLLQTSNWKSTGKGFLHVFHNTPTLCWAMASTNREKAKAEMSYNIHSNLSSKPSVITLGYSA